MRIAGIDVGGPEPEGLRSLLIGVAVRHDDDHWDGLAALDEVVQDLGRAAHGCPRLLVASTAVQQVKDGVFGPFGILVTIRGIYDHAAVEAEQGAVVPHGGKGAAMSGFVVDSGALAGDEHHVEVTGTVTLDLIVDRVIDGYSVHDEVVGVDLGLEAGDGDLPDASRPLRHGNGTLALSHPVAGKVHRRGVVSGKAESHGAAVIHFGRDHLLTAGEIGNLLGRCRHGKQQNSCKQHCKSFHVIDF